MGSDDFFHERRAQKAKLHRREIARRDPYERILIVCEGEKTEPNYFRWLRSRLGLNRANIVIADKRGGLDPKRLVEYGINEYNKEKDFDHVHCVFDKDKHTTYQGALDKIRFVQLRGKAKIHAITSVPCFEFWLLLHFTYTTRQYSAPPDESDCALVVTDLRHHIPDYEKGSQDFLSYIDDAKINDAITHAKRIATFHETSGTDNPSTNVHHLVEYLMSLKR